MTEARLAIVNECLTRAVQGQSVMNYQNIFDGFMAKGIDIADIKPRENVFTFNAWKALGRTVRKGERGVKAVTFVPVSSKETPEGKKDGFKMPRTTTVFHISQTDEVSA